ncbi:Putative ribonuclease H protein At1g65750 [Linum perenne]
MDSKLAGWKGRTLSLVGRVTLAQSVLAPIPTYAIQTSLLPIDTCKEIDKRIRSFFWGSSDERRKIHMMNWDQICAPKDKGGLGLRQARLLNLTYMIKLAFICFQKPDLSWVRVLQGKYLKETTSELVEQVVGRSPAREELGPDNWIWGDSHDGRFSNSSAYNLITEQSAQQTNGNIMKVWKWVGPNRVKCFLWLAFHERLITNAKRARCHLTTSLVCSRCGDQ